MVIKRLHWTEHSKIKMRQYGLSKTKLINLLYKPERKEGGIVPGTTAVMKTNRVSRNLPAHKIFFQKSLVDNKRGKFHYTAKRAPGEVWLMFKDVKDQRKIISAWRYPGVTKPGDQIPIPEDIRKELMSGREFE